MPGKVLPRLCKSGRRSSGEVERSDFSFQLVYVGDQALALSIKPDPSGNLHPKRYTNDGCQTQLSADYIQHRPSDIQPQIQSEILNVKPGTLHYNRSKYRSTSNLFGASGCSRKYCAQDSSASFSHCAKGVLSLPSQPTWK